MLRLLFDLALRVSEVVTLDLADLESDRGTLWVMGKGRGNKELMTLAAPTLAALSAWIAVRGTAAGPLFLVLGPRRHSKRRDSRFSTRGVYRIVKQLGQRAGAKVWPHALRHTAITTAVEAAPAAGISLDEIRQFSRHKTINTLLVYRDRVRNVQGQLSSLVADTVAGGTASDGPDATSG